jgi:hypothetical protein
MIHAWKTPKPVRATFQALYQAFIARQGVFFLPNGIKLPPVAQSKFRDFVILFRQA